MWTWSAQTTSITSLTPPTTADLLNSFQNDTIISTTHVQTITAHLIQKKKRSVSSTASEEDTDSSSTNTTLKYNEALNVASSDKTDHNIKPKEHIIVKVRRDEVRNPVLQHISLGDSSSSDETSTRTGTNS